MASGFLSLMRSPNSASRREMISVGFMGCPRRGEARHGPARFCEPRLNSGLGWRGLFLGALGEFELLFHRLDRVGVVELRRQLHIAGPRGDGDFDGLVFGEV